MENSAFESILIGVSVFIFIIALTVAVHLLVTVLDMSYVANNIMKNENEAMVKVDTDIDKIVYGRDIIMHLNDESMLDQFIIVDEHNIEISLAGVDLGAYRNKMFTMSYIKTDASGKIKYQLTEIY